MIGLTIGESCHIPEQNDKTLVYIEYLSTAPWNLIDLVSKINVEPRFRAVGTSLLSTTVEYSLKHGFCGRIGLSALPQAVSFYRDACKMTDLGIVDFHDSLRYFEFTEEQAKSFLKE